MYDQWRLTAFRAAHAQALELRPKARAVLEGLGGVPELAARYEAAGPAWTLFAGGRPLACGGVVRFWPGAGELWCWFAADVREHAVVVARHARRAMSALREGHGFARMQAHVRADDEQAQAFAAFVGLRREGTCQGYGPDQATHHLYGRFWQWKA